MALLATGVVLPVDGPRRDVDEVAGARLGHLPTTRAGLQAAPAVGHVDRRLVVAVVVPGGRRPGVGADEARPHPAGRDGLFPVHTRRRMTRDPFAWRDVAGRFSGAHASP